MRTVLSRQINSVKSAIPLTYWYEFLDLVYFSKVVNGIVNVSEAVIPQARTARATRSNSACTQYKIVKCKTATFQKSFFNRSIRIWNTLVHNVDNFISSDLRSFRNALLYNYYFPALSAVYDSEDPSSILRLASLIIMHIFI